jgi:alkanesulfonate monooxygenase SsuD/methylene tetrahydromethanopterin reductase-like flavin-dependent oxidoreductase (luciferase family)
MFKPNHLTLGILFAIEAYEGSIPKMEGQVELAQRAEELEFSGLWFRDVPLYDSKLEMLDKYMIHGPILDILLDKQKTLH